MKKKHRDITVNGIQYGWMVKHGDVIVVYKDKKIIIEQETYNRHHPITPSVVESVIKGTLARPMHELLTLVRDKANVEKGKIVCGLCYEIDNIFDDELITCKESDILLEYVNENKPKYVLPKSYENQYYNMNGFGWLPRKWKPRLEWLNVHIELNKQL